MKRTNDYDISLPSPQYSDFEEFESPTKRIKDTVQTHDLNTLIDDQLLEFVTLDGVKEQKFRSLGKPLVLVFFGVIKDHLDEIEQSYNTIRSFAEIIGVSANLTHNEHSFPLINGTLLTKKFNVRDPMGGGVYPKDILVFFDKAGKERHQVLLGYNGRRLITKPVDEVIKDVLEEMGDLICIEETDL